ncbi:DUF1129 family protein [Paenibacillus physcomitrellae]|uniref:DUF1129 family protein n=1 Tax=Paenibacillus physcomitrellae TaxID=1619311 RepID=A0ABQ1FTU2_9BACL|nr:DUF1129 family protein [Paenibacillus physcomitrellae]GGA28282.1 hypothetical protein GCM10010917_11570 [Paenibacillus physcomitrellae]
MHVKELIQENNRKRELLSKDNEKYYTGLLIYIRTSFNTSEQETEEILMEVLDHLLEAQEEGRTAEEVFGEDPQAYAREIVGELPTAMPKEVVKLVSMFGLIFLGVFAFITGLFASILSFVFNQGESVYHLHLGSLTVTAAVSVLGAYILIAGILRYIRWSAFRSIRKVKEIVAACLIGGGVFAIFAIGLYFMPRFGPPIDIPVYVLALIGAILYGAGKWLENKK